MAQHNNANNSNVGSQQQQQQHQLVNPMFHDFLGMKKNLIDSNAPKTPNVHVRSSSPSSTTVSRGVGPISTISDLGSGKSLPPPFA